MMKLRNAILLLIVLAIAALFIFAPWTGLIEQKLKDELASRGFNQINFTLEHAGLTGSTVKNITFGTMAPLSIDEVTLQYSPLQLLRGKFETARIITVDFKTQKNAAQLRNLTITMTPGEMPSTWQGRWHAGSLEMQNTPIPLQMMSGSGTFTINTASAHVEGIFKSNDNKQSADFFVDHSMQDAKKSQLIFNSVNLPWGQGLLYTENAIVPLSGTDPISVTLQASRISLGAIMQMISRGRADASGLVSGVLPFNLYQGGQLQIVGGSFKADGTGILNLTPELIPGSGPEINVVRDILSDFRYTEFSLQVDSAEDNKLAILMSLAGNNPSVYDGREARLNVRLTGDLLGIMQGSNPNQILERVEDAQ